jgi:hypothetical protein
VNASVLHSKAKKLSQLRDDASEAAMHGEIALRDELLQMVARWC